MKAIEEKVQWEENVKIGSGENIRSAIHRLVKT